MFVIGVALGRIWFGFALLPIVYGVPRTVWNIIRGELRSSAILVYVFPAVLWSVLLFIPVLIVLYFAPGVASALFASSASATGQLLGIFLGLLQMMSVQGRRDLDADFWAAVSKFRRAESGA
ncbi:MAG: hypothetical protein HY657_12435 [Acidobacteria bacterium]|nr:hypothetical protein [Acidobacteriota bacterium]